MVKRRRYARKKRSYKKRMYKKRGFKRGGKLKTSYDGVYYAKLHFSLNMLFDNLIGAAHMNIGWGQQGASDAYNYFIDDNDEFNQLRPNFRMWRLKGMKIHVIPPCEVTKTDTVAGGSSLYNIVMASYPDTMPTNGTTLIQMAKQSDYKDYSTRSTGPKKYIGLGKFWWKRGYKWLPTGTAAANYYPAAGTRILMNTSGYLNNAVVARVHITYYCAFKNWGSS